MYIPAHFAADDGLLRSLLTAGALADLVTAGPEGLQATPLPLLLSEDGTALQGHVARNNPQWRADGAAALVIVRGADAYVSPGWYESKREHGRVVPTWNYEVVHVRGRL
ncbi:MAG: transcriptional regulator, partial [Nocardioidaceae bacterium]|nr:transcriptional regulator [Nocardioidaceae bacterium]